MQIKQQAGLNAINEAEQEVPVTDTGEKAPDEQSQPEEEVIENG